MIDAETIILAELERLAPEHERIAPDWEDALRRANSLAEPRAPRPRSRWQLALAVLVVALAVAAPTFALSSGVRGLLGIHPPHPVASKELLLLSAPIGNGHYAHLFHAPSSTGGVCEFVSTDRQAVLHGPVARGGGECSVTGTWPIERPTKARPLRVSVSIERRPREGIAANWTPPVVNGSVYPGMHAARVELSWRGGVHRLLLRDGYFLGGTPTLYMPSFDKFPFSVIVYDAAGNEVGRQKLQSPGLLLLNGGWKQYAREYHHWKKAHQG